jgi:hypothetical protein
LGGKRSTDGPLKEEDDVMDMMRYMVAELAMNVILLCNSGPLLALSIVCLTVIICVMLQVIGKYLR